MDMMGPYFDDVADMKRILKYLGMSEVIPKITLTKGISMEDVKVKSGKLSKLKGLIGFNHILYQFAKDYRRSRKLIGRNPAERALIHQWLQYALMHLRVRYPTEYVLKELDYGVSDLTFFAAHNLTIVDPLIYLSLHHVFELMTFMEKEKLPNLCRWFKLIQEDETLRLDNKKIVFFRSPV